MPLKWRISQNQLIAGTWTPSFYGYDGMGNVRQLLNASGAVTDSYEYDAYGNPFTVSGSTPNNYLYRGEQYDSDLGMYYLRARYYNPHTGRFISPDPFPGFRIAPKTQHHYSYVIANPVNWIDPSGMDAEEEEGEIDLGEAESETEGEMAAAKEISCIYNTGSSLLGVLFASDQLEAVFAAGTLAINAAECAAEGTEEEPSSKGGVTCSQCFAAGTPVHTERGEVPVEQIEEGDKVLARNSRTGTLEWEPVTALVPPHQGDLLNIRVEGEREPLRPSVRHPFWARHKGGSEARWIGAGKLQVGDVLETTHGDWRMVTAITPVSGEQTVYNFTVDKDHDYFVGETGFLVHNAGCPCQQPVWTPDRIVHVNSHGTDNPLKKLHGVFAGDPIAMTNQAWQEVLAGNATRDLSDPALAYWVDSAEAGLQGGQVGNAAGNPILNRIRIILNPNNCEVISAYPVP